MNSMDFFQTVERRRSVRKYMPDPVPEAVIHRAVDAALLAPNSSNMQTWRIYWVRDAEKKARLVEACLSQGAARTAQELLVFVADPGTWKISQRAIMESIGSNPRDDLKRYYGKLIPFVYGWRFLAPVKWLMMNSVGLFRPMMRGPWSSRGISEVSIKSTALACENFMLAMSAQGYDTCPMEGLDEVRVAKILRLGCRARVVMVISVGVRDPRGIWGERFRLPKETVFHQV